MAFRIQIRRDTSSTWAVNNPILLEGEFGYETNTSLMKIGDGTTPWNDLEYWNPFGYTNASIYKDGIEILAGVTGFNFTGSGITGITGSDGFATVTISGGTGGGGSAINSYFTGAQVGVGITGLNFTGSGVSAVTDSSGYTTVTITGGAGSGSAGTSGTSGVSGSSGTSGVTGSSGTSGVNGSSGTSGANGSSGTSGTAGSSGTSGESGSSGTSGTSGSSGSAGTSGVNGSSGTSGTAGSSGTSGTSGSSGTAGTSGSSGTSGTSGSSGSAGTSGVNGSSGTSGTSGSTGTSGTSGSSGTSGTSGTSGSAGTSGVNGSSGTSGVNGSSGTSGTSGSSGSAGTSGVSASYTGYLDQSYDLSTFTPGVSTINATDTELRFLSFTAYQSAIFTSTSNSDYFIVTVSSYTSSTGNIQGTVVYKSGSSTSTRWASNLSAVGIGSSGTSGSAGTSGVNGSSGTSGVNGSSGTSGTSGSAGTSGTSGSSGTAGTSGTSGVSVTGPTGPTGAAGSGGSSTVYNTVSRYRTYLSGNAQIWMESSSTVYTGLSWTRSSTTLTITHNSHGRSNGDMVIVRNANADNFNGTITYIDPNSFSVTTANSGAFSGSAAAYSLGFTSTSVTSTGSTITAPSGGDVQLMSMLISDSMSGTYTLTTPQSSVNGAGQNDSIYNSYAPVWRVYNAGGATTTGATMTLTSTPNVFVWASTGTGDRNIRAQF